ncbi:MAG TPA: hypothetical protein VFP58_12315 [Candidatus Eisenbacteria bacterium]|nr:hypothetical protein [Candidatus Eisenbacteria bacterium]
MSLARIRTLIPAVFALVLFLSGLGAALAHDHPTGATCEVCKLAHGSPADLARRSTAPEPLRAAERMAPAASALLEHPDLVVPQGRAPPTA